MKDEANDIADHLLVEAVCEARNFVTNTLWHDGVTEGVARIERMIAEKQIAIVRATLSTAREGNSR